MHSARYSMENIEKGVLHYFLLPRFSVLFEGDFSSTIISNLASILHFRISIFYLNLLTVRWDPTELSWQFLKKLTSFWQDCFITYCIYKAFSESPFIYWFNHFIAVPASQVLAYLIPLKGLFWQNLCWSKFLFKSLGVLNSGTASYKKKTKLLPLFSKNNKTATILLNANQSISLFSTWYNLNQNQHKSYSPLKIWI